MAINTYLKKGDLKGIKLIACNWSVKTAGPSPYDNNRTELFFLGCKKALEGNPCKGCFNSQTWNDSKAIYSHNPILMAQHINENAPNKYITIGGGDPLDQIDNLLILCKELKKYNFNIMVYSWRRLLVMLDKQKSNYDLEHINKNKILKLLKYIDIFVDGEYIQEQRLWDGTKNDGLISSVGSGNQIIWDINNKIGYKMKDIIKLQLTENNLLKFYLKNESKELKF